MDRSRGYTHSHQTTVTLHPHRWITVSLYAAHFRIVGLVDRVMPNAMSSMWHGRPLKIGFVGPLAKLHHHGRLPSFSSSKETEFSSILEIDSSGDFRATFAASKCWGRRPCLLRNVFDPGSLMGSVDPCLSQPWWPSWCDVIDIARDHDSESR